MGSISHLELLDGYAYPIDTPVTVIIPAIRRPLTALKANRRVSSGELAANAAVALLVVDASVERAISGREHRGLLVFRISETVRCVVEGAGFVVT